MTEPPPQAAGLVAPGRYEGDLYPLPPGAPLARAEHPGGHRGPRVPGGSHAFAGGGRDRIALPPAGGRTVTGAAGFGRTTFRPHGRDGVPDPAGAAADVPRDARLPLHTTPSE
ncbi:hypothetical protein [Streptomyces sp. NPDC058457]|uniref:hypothetical protein n=1 Tax=Streptomyces sp. NPDC058457 TaxID=3346507 RepID=UPI00365EEE28